MSSQTNNILCTSAGYTIACIVVNALVPIPNFLLGVYVPFFLLIGTRLNFSIKNCCHKPEINPQQSEDKDNQQMHSNCCSYLFFDSTPQTRGMNYGSLTAGFINTVVYFAIPGFSDLSSWEIILIFALISTVFHVAGYKIGNAKAESA